MILTLLSDASAVVYCYNDIDIDWIPGGQQNTHVMVKK